MTIVNQTKKNICYSVLCILALIIVSCKDKNELAVSPTTINFAANETTAKEVEITTDAKEWDFSVETSGTWLNVEKQGNKLRLTPKSTNTTSLPRSAEITVTVKNTDPVKVAVTQSSAVLYNTADCIYMGDLLGNGTSLFALGLYQSSNPNIGLGATGFCSFNSFANFKLDTGTYNIASTGAVRTLLPGKFEGKDPFGTFLYNLTTNKFTFITGGTMTVSLSGNIYTIECSFTGKDAITGEAVNNIFIIFTGIIDYEDESNFLPEKSTYTATGTPKLSPSSPKTWTGVLNPDEEDNYKWYEITNWGNDKITVYCDVEDGEILFNDYTRVAFFDKYDCYFKVGFIEGDYIYMASLLEKCVIKYDPSTNILDFTETLTYKGTNEAFMGKTYEALAGIAVYNRATGSLEGFLTDFYAGVKLQLTPVSTRSGSAISQKLGINATLRHIKNIAGVETRSFTGNNPTNIVIDEELESKMQKIPLKDFKILDNLQ